MYYLKIWGLYILRLIRDILVHYLYIGNIVYYLILISVSESVSYCLVYLVCFDYLVYLAFLYLFLSIYTFFVISVVYKARDDSFFA